MGRIESTSGKRSRRWLNVEVISIRRIRVASATGLAERRGRLKRPSRCSYPSGSGRNHPFGRVTENNPTGNEGLFSCRNAYPPIRSETANPHQSVDTLVERAIPTFHGIAKALIMKSKKRTPLTAATTRMSLAARQRTPSRRRNRRGRCLKTSIGIGSRTESRRSCS